jgi:hypothetical protein
LISRLASEACARRTGAPIIARHDVANRPTADLFLSNNEQPEKKFRGNFENYETVYENCQRCRGSQDSLRNRQAAAFFFAPLNRALRFRFGGVAGPCSLRKLIAFFQNLLQLIDIL